MSRRKLTVDRYKEIERLLAAGRGVREITRALKCSRRLVRQVRDGLHGPPDQPRSAADPLWMAQVNWSEIVHDLGLGHPLKFLWEEKAQSLTTYLELLEAVLPQVPPVPAGGGDRPGLRTRRARRG